MTAKTAPAGRYGAFGRPLRGRPRWQKALAALLLLAAAVWAADRLFPPPLDAGQRSVLVTDRNGVPLRAFPAEAGRWRLPADLDRIDPLFIDTLIGVEDKRFHRHHGTDWAAMLRAGWSSLRAGRVVSGGSTITMQTARLLEPRPRNVWSKAIEIVRAAQIERRLTKREILELYLTHTPYGGNLVGVEAASWRYFGHAPGRLSDAEIALLIALPQAPEAYRPDLRPGGARAGRARIAAKAARLGLLTEARAQEAANDPLPYSGRAFPDAAWHASASAVRAADMEGDERQTGRVASTLDAGLQSDLEALLERSLVAAGPDIQAAALIVHVPGRAVRAAAGSAGRDRPGGWMDLSRQSRSPGSALKPFIYAMAFDDGTAHRSTQLADLPRQFSGYAPGNFDKTFRGDVTLEEALQHSLNIPAVLVLEGVGTGRFIARLAQAGARLRLPARHSSDPGLAVALGGGGMTLEDVAVLYAALADGGIAKPLAWTPEQAADIEAASGKRLVSAQSAATVLDILAAAPVPEGRMPARLTGAAPDLAFKTGTSYGFRDAWAAGVSGDHALIVWVGRADGAPVPGQTGRATALPLLFEMADRVSERLGGTEGAGSRLATARKSASRASAQRFSPDDAAPEIAFPPPGAALWAGPVNGQRSRSFVLSGHAPSGTPLRWFVDGAPVEEDAAGQPVWQPERSGFYRVSAVDAGGRSANVSVRVEGATPLRAR